MDEMPMKIIEDQITQEFGQMFQDYDSGLTSEEEQQIEAEKRFQLNLQRFIESRLIIGVSPTGNVNAAINATKDN